MHKATRKWERIKTPTPSITKRHLHTALYYENAIYVFGGCNQEESFRESMILDIESWTWYELEVFGTIPLPRSGHTATLINNFVILYYGGTDSDGELLYDIRAFDLRNFNTFYIFIFLYLFLFYPHTGTYTWIKYDCSSSKERQPLHRAGHHLEVIGTSIYAFGGNSVFCMHELLPRLYLFICVFLFIFIF